MVKEYFIRIREEHDPKRQNRLKNSNNLASPKRFFLSRFFSRIKGGFSSYENVELASEENQRTQTELSTTTRQIGPTTTDIENQSQIRLVSEDIGFGE